jgi:hypothetical protein
MKADKTLRVLKRKLTTVGWRLYGFPLSEDFLPVDTDLLKPGWDRGIDIVFASLDRKTLTLAYYEQS